MAWIPTLGFQWLLAVAICMPFVWLTNPVTAIPTCFIVHRSVMAFRARKVPSGEGPPSGP